MNPTKPTTLRERLRRRRDSYTARLLPEARRLAREAAALGAEKVILFGSAARGTPGLAGDIDLLIIWNTPLNFLERTSELYRRLKPAVAADLLVYTPEELRQARKRPFIRNILREGEVLHETAP
jgi:predicted nucleotidyltransferase